MGHDSGDVTTLFYNIQQYRLSRRWEPLGTVDPVFSSLKTLCLAVCLPLFCLGLGSKVF